jgi:hypothetical protein
MLHPHTALGTHSDRFEKRFFTARPKWSQCAHLRLAYHLNAGVVDLRGTPFAVSPKAWSMSYGQNAEDNLSVYSANGQVVTLSTYIEYGGCT